LSGSRGLEKTPEDILQQEILKERAEVLGKAGISVEKALAKLRDIEADIEEKKRLLTGLAQGDRERLRAIKEINREISRFNNQREYVKLRFYYLVVTREALGLRRHQRIEEFYRIPPKKRHIREA